MVFSEGNKVKIKRCKYIEPDYWGALAIIEKIVYPEGYAVIRYVEDFDTKHNTFECKIDCLEKVEL